MYSDHLGKPFWESMVFWLLVYFSPNHLSVFYSHWGLPVDFSLGPSSETQCRTFPQKCLELLWTFYCYLKTTYFLNFFQQSLWVYWDFKKKRIHFPNLPTVYEIIWNKVDWVYLTKGYLNQILPYFSFVVHVYLLNLCIWYFVSPERTASLV